MMDNIIALQHIAGPVAEVEHTYNACIEFTSICWLCTWLVYESLN